MGCRRGRIRVSVQQDLERGHQQHKERDSFALGQEAEPLRQNGAQREGHSLRHVAAVGGTGQVAGQSHGGQRPPERALPRLPAAHDLGTEGDFLQPQNAKDALGHVMTMTCCQDAAAPSTAQSPGRLSHVVLCTHQRLAFVL